MPLTWAEHEAPYDFYRYTRFGLGHLLADAGRRSVDRAARAVVEARYDWPTLARRYADLLHAALAP